jgi:hypothetical protein
MVCPVESTARYKISVLSFGPDVGFIDAVAFIGAFQVRAATPVQFRPVDLHPAPDVTGVDGQTPFQSYLGHVRK